MNLDIAFRDCAALRGLTRDRDGELIHVVARLAVVLRSDSEGAWYAVLRAGAGERRIVAGNSHTHDRNAVHVQIASMVLVLELSAGAVSLVLCVEPEVCEASRYVDFPTAGYFPS